MTRLETLKKMNNGTYKINYLSRGNFLIAPIDKYIKVSTDNEEWKKYVFNFEESKLILKAKNILDFVLDFERVGKNTIQLSLNKFVGKNKVVYDSVKIRKKEFESILIFYGELQELCKNEELKEVRFL